MKPPAKTTSATRTRPEPENKRDTAPEPRVAAVSGRRFEKSAIKRQAILDAAARTFREKGYAETRLSDIAGRIGTKAGAIYYHFESRDQLVEEVLAGSMTRISGAVEESLRSLPDGSSYKLKMHTALQAHIEQLLVHDDYMVAYYKLYDQVPEEIRARWVHLPRRYGDLWKELLQGAAAAGEIRSDLDLSVVRMLLMGAVTWVREWYKRGKMPPEQIGAHLSALFFDGMATQPASAPLDPGLSELIDLVRDLPPSTIAALIQSLRLLTAGAKD